MRCLFCKRNSSNAKSIEHIIPESLGNTTMCLPHGYICDRCNNYLAIKIEKPFLDSKYAKELRIKMDLRNKKGHAPPTLAYFDDTPGLVHVEGEQNLDIIIEDRRIFDNLVAGNFSEMRIPIVDRLSFPENNDITSRFIAKVALEAFSIRIEEEAWFNYIIDNEDLDPIRNYVRYGIGKTWACSIRKIYNEDKQWDNESFLQPMNKVFEYDFLLIEKSRDEKYAAYDCFFVLCLWGIEYAINMTDSSIDYYYDWLKDHNNVSPLYVNDPSVLK